MKTGILFALVNYFDKRFLLYVWKWLTLNFDQNQKLNNYKMQPEHSAANFFHFVWQKAFDLLIFAPKSRSIFLKDWME